MELEYHPYNFSVKKYGKLFASRQESPREVSNPGEEFKIDCRPI